MSKKRFIVASLLIQAAILLPQSGRSMQKPEAIALRGMVSSQEEGPMEGVLVSAKRDGSTITITVVSDAQGRYTFPQTRLQRGRYSLRIRAVGYELSGPAVIEISSQKVTQVDLILRKTQDLASQLTNSEWFISMPETREQKLLSVADCVGCHTLERIVRSRHKGPEWLPIVQRMGTYIGGSIGEHPQMVPPGSVREDQMHARYSASSLDYLSTINLGSDAQWPYSLKTLPRPKDKATRVIITEYDLPRQYILPHDVTVDSDGTVWYCDFGEHQHLGHLDPKTGKVVEYTPPVVKSGLPNGTRSVEFDSERNIWISMGPLGTAGKFDRKTEKFQTWDVPKVEGNDDIPNIARVLPQGASIDGKIWVQVSGNKLQRLDIRTGQWEKEAINVFKDLPKNSSGGVRHALHDTLSDAQNNLYFSDNQNELISKVDAKTKKVTYYPTPTHDSGPRRLHFDDQGRLWFGEFRGNRIGMFDPQTEKFQEWEMATPFECPYDAVLDKNGDAWTGGVTSDRISRVNTKTGEVIDYLLPQDTNIRKVEIDNSSNPVSFWAGNLHKSSIVRVEAIQ